MLARRLLERVAATQSPRRLALATWTALLGANLRELDPWLRGDEAQWLASVKHEAHAPQPLEVECELPDWVIERLRARDDVLPGRDQARGEARDQPASAVS